MTELYNKVSEKDKRQYLRNNMPPAEQLVWARLKGKQVGICKFRRQYGVGAFVIDFYAVEIKLAIEIDGDSHFRDGAEVYDRERQSSIEAAGIRFLRFTNKQVYEELDAVIESISQMICDLRELPHPNPPLIKGRETEKPSLLGALTLSTGRVSRPVGNPNSARIRFIRGVGG